MNIGRRTRVGGSRSSSSRRVVGSAFAPTLSVLAAAALFGTTGTALAKGPDGIEALSAGSLRLLIGGAGLCLIGGRAMLANVRQRSDRRITLILAGGITVASYQLGFFWATESTGVALATVVTIGSAPLVSRVIAAVRKRPTPDVWWIVSAVGLILGLVLLVIGSASGTASVEFDLWGVVAATVAGASYAAYTEVGSEMMVRGWHPTSAMAGIFFAAGLLTSPILFVRDVGWFGTSAGLGVMLYLSLVTLTLAYLWFGWGLERLPPTTVVMLTMFEPVVAAVLAIIVLDERLSGISWFGILVVLVCLAIVGLRSRPTNATTVETTTVTA